MNRDFNVTPKAQDLEKAQEEGKKNERRVECETCEILQDVMVNSLPKERK